MTDVENGSIGSSFDDFLEEEGLAHEVTHIAVKKVLAEMLKAEMEKSGMSQSALALKMQTSRTQVRRLLDPENDSVTLNTMQRAAQIFGREVRIGLV